MEIKQKQNDSKGSFYVELDGVAVAEMTYSLANSNIMIIDHTQVDDVLRGKNVGYQLVKAGVDYARSHQLKIIPLCPFAKSVFEKKGEEFKDVLRNH